LWPSWFHRAEDEGRREGDGEGQLVPVLKLGVVVERGTGATSSP